MKSVFPTFLFIIFGFSHLKGQCNNQHQGSGDLAYVAIEHYDINGRNAVDSQETDSLSLFQVRKNAVFLEFFIVYPGFGISRIIPLKSNFGLVINGAFTPWWELITELEGGIILGRHKHFFEAIGGYWFVADNTYIKLGYRYQSRKGFLLRISPAWSISEGLPMWTVSLGYSF